MLRKLFTWQYYHYGHRSLWLGLTNRDKISMLNGNFLSIQQRNNNSFRETDHPNSQQQPLAGDAVPDEDALTEKIHQVKSLDQLMDIANTHHNIMNNKHLYTAFSKISDFVKSNSSQSKEIVKKMQLQPLCREVVKRVRFFNPDECITIFKVMTFCKVPSESAVVQSLCQMLRHNINELPMGSLMFLDFLLSKHSQTPLTDALRIAIPIVVKARLSTELNSENVVEVITCLRIICKSNPSVSDVEKLCAHIMPKCSDLHASRILYTVCLLTEMLHKPANYQEFLTTAVEVLRDNLDQLSHSECHGLIYQIVHYPEVLSNCPGLLTSLSHAAKANNWDLGLLSPLIGLYNKYEYISMEVLDLAAQKMVQEPDLVNSHDRVSLLSLAEGFVYADYLPGPFLQPLLDSKDKLFHMQKNAPHLYVKLITLYALLDIAPPDMVASVCNEDFVTIAFHTAKPKGWERSLLLHLNILNQYANLYLQNYSGKLLTKAFVEEVMKLETENNKQAADPVLQNFLEIGLGGPRFVLHGLWTRLGHFIDHAIVMRKEDFPVAINKSHLEDDDKTLKYPEKNDSGFQFIEDLAIPEDSKILAVLLPRRHWIAKDPSRPTAYAMFQQRSLSKMGYNSIIIRPNVVHNLLDREKIPYVMREINDALRQNSLSSQCV